MTSYTETKQATAPPVAEAGRAFEGRERDHLHFDRDTRVWWRHLDDGSLHGGETRHGSAGSSEGSH